MRQGNRMNEQQELPEQEQPEVGQVRAVSDDVPVEGTTMTDEQQTIAAMQVTIQALQSRIMRLEMEIVDGISAQIAQGGQPS